MSISSKYASFKEKKYEYLNTFSNNIKSSITNKLLGYLKDKFSQFNEFKKIIVILGVMLPPVFAYIVIKFYINILLLNEIGNFSHVFIINSLSEIFMWIMYFVVFFSSLIFSSNLLTSSILRINPTHKLLFNTSSKISFSLLFSFLLTKLIYDDTHINFLHFVNSTDFNSISPVINTDISTLVFKLPFLENLLHLLYVVCISIFIWTNFIGLIELLSSKIAKENNEVFSLVKIFKSFLNKLPTNFKNHQLIVLNILNVLLFYVVKIFSYYIQDKKLVFDEEFMGFIGAGYLDAMVWHKIYSVFPFILLIIVGLSIYFLTNNKIKYCIVTLLSYPTIFLIVYFIFVPGTIALINTNPLQYEKDYITHNIEFTQKAYNLSQIKQKPLELKPHYTNNQNNNSKIKISFVPNINFSINNNTQSYDYNYLNKDVVSYSVDNKKYLTYISPSEINYDKIQYEFNADKSTKFTHGYGVKMVPYGYDNLDLSNLINGVEQSKEILNKPQLYYNENKNQVLITNLKNGVNEHDFIIDKGYETRYQGKGGLFATSMNKFFISLYKNRFNLFNSESIAGNSKILLNTNVISRVKLALPFLKIYEDPYLIVSDEGTLHWIVDAYTTTSNYPYSEKISIAKGFENSNYIRNSVKIIVDAYEGSLDCYIIDNSDPIIKMYDKLYKNIFIKKPLPDFVMKNQKYPNLLLNIAYSKLIRYSNASNIDEFIQEKNILRVNKDFTEDTSNSYYNNFITPYYNLTDINSIPNEFVSVIPLVNLSRDNDYLDSILVISNQGNSKSPLTLFKTDDNIKIPSSQLILKRIDDLLTNSDLDNKYKNKSLNLTDLHFDLSNDEIKYYYPIWNINFDKTHYSLDILIIVHINSNDIYDEIIVFKENPKLTASNHKLNTDSTWMEDVIDKLKIQELITKYKNATSKDDKDLSEVE